MAHGADVCLRCAVSLVLVLTNVVMAVVICCPSLLLRASHSGEDNGCCSVPSLVVDVVTFN